MKRNPVIMPRVPPYAILKAMAGDPLILAASDEWYMRVLYRTCRAALKAKRKGGK